MFLLGITNCLPYCPFHPDISWGQCAGYLNLTIYPHMKHSLDVLLPLKEDGVAKLFDTLRGVYKRYNEVIGYISFCHGFIKHVPDSKIDGANMGPTWVLSAPGGPHVGPTSLAIRDSMITHMVQMQHIVVNTRIMQPVYTIQNCLNQKWQWSYMAILVISVLRWRFLDISSGNV